jgi:hypothetical protein
MRTSVGGDRREQTHCFHDRHIGGGDLGKNTSSSNRDCNGVSEPTISIRKEPQATPFSSEGTCGWKNKVSKRHRLTQPLLMGDVIGRSHIWTSDNRGRRLTRR